MIRALRIYLARRALARALAEVHAYDSAPVGRWSFPVAYALRVRSDRLALRLANLIVLSPKL